MSEHPDGHSPPESPDAAPAADEAAHGPRGAWSWRRPLSGWSTPGQWSGVRTLVAMVAALVVGGLGALGASAAIARSGDGGRGDVGRGQGQFPGGQRGGGGHGDGGRPGGQGGIQGQDAPPGTGSPDPSDANGTAPTVTSQ